MRENTTLVDLLVTTSHCLVLPHNHDIMYIIYMYDYILFMCHGVNELKVVGLLFVFVFVLLVLFHLTMVVMAGCSSIIQLRSHVEVAEG